VQNMLDQNANIVEIAKAAGLSRQTIYRIKDDPAAAEGTHPMAAVLREA
jgi:putative DNA-invertase from lambdoid prophage Rac